MGSLVPGWDRELPGKPSEEWADFEEEADKRKKGYFERYNELKASRKKSTDGPLESSLGRLSLSPSADSSVRDQHQGLARHSAPLMDETGRVRRSTSLTHGIPEEQPTEPSRLLSPERHLRHAESEGTRSPRAQPKGDQDRWWRKLSSAALNEPDEGDQGPPGAKPSSYTPQYDVTGQRHHYHLESDSGEIEELLRQNSKTYLPGISVAPEAPVAARPTEGSS